MINFGNLFIRLQFMDLFFKDISLGDFLSLALKVLIVKVILIIQIILDHIKDILAMLLIVYFDYYSSFSLLLIYLFLLKLDLNKS